MTPSRSCRSHMASSSAVGVAAAPCTNTRSPLLIFATTSCGLRALVALAAVGVLTGPSYAVCPDAHAARDACDLGAALAHEMPMLTIHGAFRALGGWARARSAGKPQFVRTTRGPCPARAGSRAGGLPELPGIRRPQRRRRGRGWWWWWAGRAPEVARRAGRTSRPAPAGRVDSFRQLRDERRVRAVSPRRHGHGAARRERQGHLAGGNVAGLGDGPRSARPVLSRGVLRRARAATQHRGRCAGNVLALPRARGRDRAPGREHDADVRADDERAVPGGAPRARRHRLLALSPDTGRGPWLADELHRGVHGRNPARDLRTVREPSHRSDAHDRQLHADLRRADREERALRDVSHGDHASP